MKERGLYPSIKFTTSTYKDGNDGKRTNPYLHGNNGNRTQCLTNPSYGKRTESLNNPSYQHAKMAKKERGQNPSITLPTNI